MAITSAIGTGSVPNSCSVSSLPSTVAELPSALMLAPILESSSPYLGFKDIYNNDTCTFCQCKCYGNLRLHIGRISRIRKSLYMCAVKSLACCFPYCIIKFLNLIRFLQALYGASRCFGTCYYSYISPVAAAANIRFRFDLIRNNRIFGVVDLLYSFDTCTSVPAPLMLAPCCWEVGDINDMWLTCCILLMITS